jgi:hypothetical protein
MAGRTSAADTRRTTLPGGLLPFPRQHGGSRAGAGRKPNGETAGVNHRQREALASRFPVHVTVKLLRALPRLRQRAEYAALRAAFAAAASVSATTRS